MSYDSNLANTLKLVSGVSKIEVEQRIDSNDENQWCYFIHFEFFDFPMQALDMKTSTNYYTNLRLRITYTEKHSKLKINDVYMLTNKLNAETLSVKSICLPSDEQSYDIAYNIEDINIMPIEYSANNLHDKIKTLVNAPSVMHSFMDEFNKG